MKTRCVKKRLLAATVLVATGTMPPWAQANLQWGASLNGDTTSGDDVRLGID